MTLVVVLNLFLFIPSSYSYSAVGTGELELDQTSPNASEKPPQDLLQTIDVSPAPRPKDAEVDLNEYFFAYRNSISGRLGLVYNSEEYKEDKSLLFLLGAQYSFQTRSLRFYEVGFDLITEGNGRLYAARKWIFSRARYRPFAKAGVAIQLIGSKGLATVLELENYQARGGIGFEQLIRPPLSLRAELELAAGIEAFEGLATTGLSWAW